MRAQLHASAVLLGAATALALAVWGCAGPATQTLSDNHPSVQPWVVVIAPPQWREESAGKLASSVRQGIARQARVQVVVSSGELDATGSPASEAAAIRAALEQAHQHYLNMRMANARRELERALEASRRSVARGLTLEQLADIHLYLAAVSQAEGNSDALRAHAEAAVVFQPALQPNADFFSPPIREAVEQARASRQVVETIIVSEPAGAAVLWDGLPLGKTPLKLPESAKGEHYLLLEHPLCLPWRDSVRLSTSAELRIKLTVRDSPEAKAAIGRAVLGTKSHLAQGARSVIWLWEEPRAVSLQVISGQGAGRRARLEANSSSSAVESVLQRLGLAQAPVVKQSTRSDEAHSHQGQSMWRRYWWAWTLAGAAIVAAGVAIPLTVSGPESSERGVNVIWPAPQ